MNSCFSSARSPTGRPPHGGTTASLRTHARRPTVPANRVPPVGLVWFEIGLVWFEIGLGPPADHGALARAAAAHVGPGAGRACRPVVLSAHLPLHLKSHAVSPPASSPEEPCAFHPQVRALIGAAQALQAPPPPVPSAQPSRQTFDGVACAAPLARNPPPPPPSRTKWTRRVPHPVLIGHVASFTPYLSDTSRPKP